MPKGWISLDYIEEMMELEEKDVAYIQCALEIGEMGFKVVDVLFSWVIEVAGKSL